MKKDLELITELRSRAYDLANSGKHGDYPYDESFNDMVEQGFNERGDEWTANDGTHLVIDWTDERIEQLPL